MSQENGNGLVMPRAKGIILIGFMGAGKSSVGRQLARRLQMSFFDIDTEIERQAGRSIADIFAEDGEQAFRDLETKYIAALDHKQAVYSTGGGIVLREENWPLMRAMGTVVYLEAPPEALFERVRKHAHRPLLQTADPWSTFNQLFAGRKRLYEKADYLVATEGMSPPAVVDRIQALFTHPK